MTFWQGVILGILLSAALRLLFEVLFGSAACR
jgi:hypothetical protein